MSATRAINGRSTLRLAALSGANLLGAIAFTWPFVLPSLVDRGDAHRADAPWIALLLAGLLGTVLFVQIERGGMGPKAIALLGTLAAAMVALRLPGFVGGFSAMFIVVLLAGNSFGPAFGFSLGALGTAASAFFVGGLGPWVPFQMVAIGWVGLGAGLMPRGTSWRARIAALSVYGVLSGFMFGALMNLWFWPFSAGSSGVGWAPELGFAENASRYGSFYLLRSFGWDALRAAGNAILVIALGRAVLPALDRAASRLTVKVEKVEPPAALAAGGPVGGNL